MAEQKVKLTDLPAATDTVDTAQLLINQNSTDQKLAVTHFLRAKNNLSELTNASQARANLDVPSVDEVNEKLTGFIDGSNTFSAGAALASRSDFIWDENSKSWYYWSGDLPKDVPAASNPESTGGVGKGAWLSVGDAALREQLGQISLLRFKDVNAIFSGITSGGITVSLKAGDNVITDGGTIWEVTNANPSSLSDIAATSPYNVIDFGADKTGINDSTDAFTSAAGCIVPAGTYRIESDLADTYYSDGDVIITGSGSVKLIPIGQRKIQKSLPFDASKLTGGPIYTTGASSLSSNTSEFYRLPSLVKSNFSGRTFLVYTVLVGTSNDIGQSETQTSRIEVRTSNNNLNFSAPTIISTEGEQQASEASIAIDEKRGRIWVFYVTARGKVGVGHGSAGFDPNATFQNWVTYSDTYGATWSTPVNITSMIKPFTASSAWTPPSPICVTGDGDLLVPYTWFTDNIFNHGYIRVTEDKGGQIKYARQLILHGGKDGGQGGGEHQIIQLGDGSFLAMIRDYFNDAGKTKGRQQFYRSYDGVNWVYQSSVDTTNCKAGMCLYASMASGDSRDTILITAPTGNDDSNLYRNNLKLWASTDNGNTWEKFPGTMFDDATVSTGYSTITPIGSGAFMVLAEGATYKSMNIKHRAIGSFTQQSNFAKSWGRLPVAQIASESTLCQYFDIPQYSLYFNSDRRTLNANIGGVALRLTDSHIEQDVSTAVSTLNSDAATTFYLSATTTIRSITGSASRVLLVSTAAANPVTLTEDSSVDIANRIRVSKSLAGKAMLLHKTKYGWYPDSGTNT